MRINGVAHIMLTVSDFEAAAPYYRKLLEFFEMKKVYDTEEWLYYVGGRTAIGIRRAAPNNSHLRFDQLRVGLHHLCFRVDTAEKIDQLYTFLRDELKAKVVHAPEQGGWAPGYYSVLWEDPDGIRLEANYVPGQGLLTPGMGGLQAKL
eukprot:TRINITY_DN86840_c0_g1_i1.p1 TRINITY_DN86840_c0_g1~~TRINITY_DN86840_c0_g1_i1.p1  ORF type:complete len:149 (-),score=31.14 TRINITY_DN86840_c0_g1_i1:21-467(-)